VVPRFTERHYSRGMPQIPPIATYARTPGVGSRVGGTPTSRGCRRPARLAGAWAIPAGAGYRARELLPAILRTSRRRKPKQDLFSHVSGGRPGARTKTAFSSFLTTANQRTAPSVPVALSQSKARYRENGPPEPPGGGSSCPTLPAVPENRTRNRTVRHSARYACRSWRPAARPPRPPAITCAAATPRQREPSHVRPPSPPASPSRLTGPR
jgi:hypothetical protein